MSHSPHHYERIRRLLDFTLRPRFRHSFILDETPLPDLPERFLLVSNHVTKLDPLLLSLSLRRFVFFVATEHLFSMGLLSRILRWAANPIPRSQGGQAAGTVMEILRRLKNQGSVAIFVEGNCCWDGVSGDFLPATGKMARAGGVPLVTVKIQGYLAAPRWGFTRRKGPVRVSLQHIYSPEELKAMSPQAINQAIARDIYEDAYATQAALPARYPGKRLAEGLEFALLICPRCKALDSLSSRDSTLSCTCGLSLTYDEWGYFSGEGEEAPFLTVRDWDAWQRDYLASLSIAELPHARDEDMQLLQIEGHKRRQLAAGSLRMDCQALSLGPRRFALEDIAELAIRYKGIVSFSDREGHFYEILKRKKRVRYHGRKYLLIYQRIRAARRE